MISAAAPLAFRQQILLILSAHENNDMIPVNTVSLETNQSRCIWNFKYVQYWKMDLTLTIEAYIQSELVSLRLSLFMSWDRFCWFSILTQKCSWNLWVCLCVCASVLQPGQCITCTYTQQDVDIWACFLLRQGERWGDRESSDANERERDFITWQTDDQMNWEGEKENKSRGLNS